MAELHVISALRDKRSELAGIVNRLQQQLAEHRASLAHLDATMLLFDPDIRPEEIQLIPTALSGHRFCPLALGDGSEAVGHLHQPVPGLGACVHDCIVALPNTVAEKVASQELPDIFHRV